MSDRRAILLAVALSGACVANAAPPVIERVEFGYDTTIVPDCWGPVTLWLSTDVPFSGSAEISYVQDSSQAARIVAPVAATPGQASPSHLVWRPPAVFNRVDLTLRDAEGAVIASRRWSLTPTANDVILPAVVNTRQSVILCAGEVSASTVIDDRILELQRSGSVGQPAYEGMPSWSGMEEEEPQSGTLVGPPLRLPANTRPDALTLFKAPGVLPIDAPAYQGAALVILDSEESGKLDPRAREAIRDWVFAGGRLLVLADRPGDQWREWVTTPGLPAPIEVGDLRKVSLPPITRASEHFTPQADARPLRLTPAGAADGWKHLTPLAFNGPLGDGDEASILAVGPVGFGMVAVLTSDPRRWTQVLSTSSTARAWERIVDEVLSDQSIVPVESQDPTIWRNFSTGEAATSRAFRQVMNFAAPAPAVGWGFVFLAVTLLGLLALAVGPVDGLYLRVVRLRHRSWATALGWIGLASMVAYVVPLILRGERWTARRVGVVDVLCAPDGQGVMARHAGVRAIAAAGGERYHWNQASSAWVSGSQLGYIWTEPTPTLPPLVTFVGSTTTADLPGTPSRTCAPEWIDMPQWGFRGVLEEAEGLDVRIVLRDNPYEQQIEISSLPAGFELQSIAVRRDLRWEQWEVIPREDGVDIWRARRLPDQPSYESPGDERAESATLRIEGSATGDVVLSHQTLFDLPGAHSRGASFQRRAWAGADMVHAVFQRRDAGIAPESALAGDPRIYQPDLADADSDSTEILLLRAVRTREHVP